MSELLRGLFLLRAAPSSNDLAAAQFKKTLEMNQNYVQTHRELGLTYEEKGMHGEAVTELQKALEKESSDIQAGMHMQ